MSTKIKISCQKFANFGRFKGSFLTILGKKSRFLDFFKVILDLFRKFLKALFATLKSLLSGVFLDQKVDPQTVYSPLGYRGNPSKLRLRFCRLY